MRSDVDELSAVIGARARAIRGPASMDALASAARQLGYRWSSGRVNEIEQGRAAMTLELLVVLASALSKVRDMPVRISDFLPRIGDPDGDVMVLRGTDHDTDGVPAGLVWDWLDGDPVDLNSLLGLKVSAAAAGLDPALTERLEIVRQSPVVKQRWQSQAPGMTFGKFTLLLLSSARRAAGRVEDRAAATLGTTPEMITAHALALWGVTLPERRDQVAGNDANAQRKGRVTRDLIAELEHAINSH